VKRVRGHSWVPFLQPEINESSKNEININVYCNGNCRLPTSVLFLRQHWSNQSNHCDQQRPRH
jgi:hypothetical protein